MAIINIPKVYLEEKIKRKIEVIIETLNKMGYPSEIEEEEVVVEVTPNRPDMLSWSGVVRALQNYLKIKKVEKYKFNGKIGVVKVHKVSSRPFIAVGVVKDVEDTKYLTESIISLQEKLDQTLGRNRKKIAIGIHDADRVEFPLTYKEVKDEVFVPLNQDKEMNVPEILKNTEQGKNYSHLVDGKFPMIYDKRGVISFPPIINSDRTKIRNNTKSFLIDVTGTHKETVDKVANIITTDLIDRGGEAYFTTNEKGEKLFDLKYNRMLFEKDKVEKLLGFKISNEKELLNKMGLELEKESVIIPPYRVDFMDTSDIAEEIAIAYGYDNIEPKKFEYYQEGETDREREFIRDVFVNMGFKEVYNFFLVSKKELAVFGLKENIEMENPLSEEFNAIRPTSIISLIKTLSENKREKLPLKFFELGRVFNSLGERGVVGFIVANEKVSVNEGLKIIERFRNELNEEFVYNFYYNNFLIEGRAFKFKGNNYEGFVGEIHPKINEKYNIDYPLVVGEITLPS